MLSAFFTVLCLYFFCCIFSYIAKNKTVNKNTQLWTNWAFYFLIFSYTFIVGTRYHVGLDYPTYEEIIKDGANHSYYSHLEFLPRIVIDFITSCQLPFYWWFIIMAFFQIIFIAISVRNSLKKVLPWVIICFFLLFLAFYLNGVRQACAMSCFLCAISYAKDRNIKGYLFCFLFAYWFHRSVILFLPCYFFFHKEFFPNIKQQYVIWLLCIFLGPIIIDLIINITKPYWELFGYAGQTETFDSDTENIAVGSGLGMIFRYLRRGLIISYYNKLKNYFGKENVVMFYNLFFIGICLDYVTVKNILLGRINMYFTIFELFILAYLFFYCSKSNKIFDKLVIIILLPLQIILANYSLLTNMLEWKFVWDYSF